MESGSLNSGTAENRKVTGEFVNIAGERFYAIRNVDKMAPCGEGVQGAAFIAALGAAIPATETLDAAIDVALQQIPGDDPATAAVRLGRDLSGQADAVQKLRRQHQGMSPLHTLNNLSVVVWALCSSNGDFGAAIGDAVAAGWDTDCNGALVTRMGLDETRRKLA
jgi:ADP-ribosylglycohydrolase